MTKTGAHVYALAVAGLKLGQIGVKGVQKAARRLTGVVGALNLPPNVAGGLKRP